MEKIVQETLVVSPTGHITVIEETAVVDLGETIAVGRKEYGILPTEVVPATASVRVKALVGKLRA